MSDWPDAFDAELKSVDQLAASWVLAGTDGHELATLVPNKKFEINSQVITTTIIFLVLFSAIAFAMLQGGQEFTPFVAVGFIAVIAINILFLNRIAGSRRFVTDRSLLFFRMVRERGSVNQMAVECTSGPARHPVFLSGTDAVRFQDGREYRILTDTLNGARSVRILGQDDLNKFNRSVVHLLDLNNTTGEGATVSVDSQEKDRPYIDALVGYAAYSYHTARASRMYTRQ